jgi:hypothetical protein
MFPALLGLLAAAVLWIPGSAWAQRIYRCVDDRGTVHIEQGVLPAWCASQYTPVARDKPGTPREVDGTKRWLEGQLASQIAREERCRTGHERVEDILDDGLDSIDELSDNRRSGRVSHAERRVAKRMVKAAAGAHARLDQCVTEAKARAGELRAAIADPVKIDAAVPEWRAAQQRIERERLAQQKAALRDAEERERAAQAKKRAAEEAEAETQRRAQAQRQVEEERARAIRRDLGAMLDRIATTSRATIDGRETARAELAQVEKDVEILPRRYGWALRAPEYREPIAAIVEGILALRAAGAALEREAQLAASSAELAARFHAMNKRMASGPSTLLDGANLDTLAREAAGTRAEHEKAVRTLADHRGALVRTVERTMQLSASLQ